MLGLEVQDQMALKAVIEEVEGGLTSSSSAEAIQTPLKVAPKSFFAPSSIRRVGF